MNPPDRFPPDALARVAIAAILLGAAWPITRLAMLQGATPAWFALGRAALSAAIATLLLAALGRLHLPRRRDVPTLLALGLLQLAGFFAFSHAAVAWVPAGRTAILSNCTIVFTVPLTLLWLREPIPPRRWAAAALGSAGILALIGPWAIDWAAPHLLLGHLELMAAALCWSIAMLVVRRAPPVSSMLELLPWAFLLASAALAPLAIAHPAGRWTPTSAVCLLVIGLVIAPAGTWCIVQAQTRLPLVVSSVGFLAGPALGVLLSTLLLHEPIGLDMIAGTTLIFAAALTAITRPRPR